MNKQLHFNTFTFTIVLLFLASFNMVAQSSFISTWDTTNRGISDDTQITIPAIGTYDADWDNDGTFDETDIADTHTHTFATEGTHTIALRSAISGAGTLNQIFFNNRGDAQKLILINQWGDTPWTSMQGAFFGCQKLDIVATDTPNLSNVTSLRQMLDNCFILQGNEHFNKWKTTTITDMSDLFLNAKIFNQDIGDWDVSNVTDISSMFLNAKAFNQDIGRWVVTKVTDISGLFYGAEAFNQNIGEWKTPLATSMSLLFYNAKSFNQDISQWNVTNVLDMNSMFEGASAFNQNISNWDVSNVIDMWKMFYNAKRFDQNLGSWDIGEITEGRYMFNNTAISLDNWDATLIGWDAQHFNNIKVTIGAKGLTYCKADKNREKMSYDDIFIFLGDTKSVDCVELGIDNITQSAITMYPNPTTGKVYLNTTIENITIYSTSGQKVKEVDNNNFDISTLQSGMYFVSLKTQQGVETKQILKK